MVEVQSMILLEEKQGGYRANKLNELKIRFKNGYSVAVVAKAHDKYSFKAFGSTHDFPPAPTYLTHFDARTNCVLIPLHGQFVPFHVNTIKNVISAFRGALPFFRFNFLTPGGGGAVAEDFPEADSRRVFIKELTVRCSSKQALHMQGVCKAIKDAQQQLKQQEFAQAHKGSGVTNIPLQIRSGSRPCLRDINMRPQIGARLKAAGRLECHNNGFRFISPKGETFDLTFANIRFAIFQAVDEKNANAILHFECHVPVTVGRKPWSGIQFLTEVVGAEDLNDRRGMSGFDAGEERDDQLQSMKIEQINAAFRHFVKQVEEAFKDARAPLSFDMPFTDLGFAGNPTKSLVYCYPTRDTIVSLQEWPSFLLCMAEVEFVVFERYSLQLQEFDMFFVLKNYEKSPVKISAIRRHEIDRIKQWLSELEMVWYHSPTPLNWNKVLKEIIRLIQTDKFFDQGAWDSWFDTNENSESSDDKDDESEYHGSESSSQDVFAPSAEESDSASEEPSEESESGLSWDEMERRTTKKEKRTGNAPAPPPAKRRRR
eukprot:GEMP01012936.1.p1 GENE.GEMP01012936.1~~GEMP01012936.1.p1  ORF type:complete len:583 (+),score=125.38 GEMP01012936.1:125-1750(+)